VAAPGHALSALRAPGALRADATEEGIGLHDARAITEVDTDGSHLEGVADSHLVGNGLHDLVAGRHGRISDDTEHARSLVVVRRQLSGPIGDVGPLPVLEESLRRDVEGVGVDQRPTADTRTGKDDDVLEHMDPLDARAPEGGGPEESAQPP